MKSDFFKEELYQMRNKYKKKPLKDLRLNRPYWLQESLDCRNHLMPEGRIIVDKKIDEFKYTLLY